MVDEWKSKWYDDGNQLLGVVSMTVEEMKRRKKELGYTNEMVAEYSGVPLSTVQKIFAGVTTSPRYETLLALEKVFKEEQHMISESVAAYRVKRQGDYTLKDYYELPEDRRAELIDGVIYDMAAPMADHQLIGTEIWDQLKSYIKSKNGKCIPFVAPVDVQLDCDDRTMVQPDVLVVCNRNKIVRRCVYGTPDFIVEVLSASTKKKDMSIKLEKYMSAGVREYWLVDPDKQKILVYDLEHNEFPAIYGFDAKVPVRIFDGECEIDFTEIYEYVKFLYE